MQESLRKKISNWLKYLRSYRKRAKQKTQVHGQNNKIVSVKNGTEYDIWEVPQNFHINGNNNTVIINCDNVRKALRSFPQGCSLNMSGDNNQLIIELPIQDFYGVAINMVEGNNKLTLRASQYGYCGVAFALQHGGQIDIGKDASIRGGDTRFYSCGSTKDSRHIIIGNGVRIAHSSVIRNMYGETLLDPQTDKPISEPKNIEIGDHVWIMTRCMVFAGCYLPEGTALAACSFANKEYKERNTLLAGVPARVIRRNIKWTVGTYHENMDKWEKQLHSEERQDSGISGYKK